MADLDLGSLQKLRVVDLREQLSARGLPTTGLKAELVKRLRDALTSTEEEDVEEQPDQQQDWPSEDSNYALNQPLGQAEEPMNIDEDSMKVSEEEEMKIAEEQERKRLEEQQLWEEQERVKAEEQQRLWDEEERKRKAEEQQRLWDEEERKRKAEEQQRLWDEEERKRKAEEQQRLWDEEERKIKAEEQQRLWDEQERKRKEEQQRLWDEEEERKRKAEEQQRLWDEMQRRKEEEQQQRLLEEERMRKEAEKQQRLQEEEQRKKEAEEQQRLQAIEEERKLAEEQERQAEKLKAWAKEQERIKAEQERKRAEEEQRIWAEQESRRLLEEEVEKIRLLEEDIKRKKELKVHLEEQRKRQMEEEKLRLAQEQQKMLAEAEKMRLAEEQQRLLAEEQKRLLAEEQQRLLAEEERQKENELFHLQQQALIEKDEEQRKQIVLPIPPPPSIPFPPGLHIHPPPPTTVPVVQPMPPVPQQIQGPPMGHVLTTSAPPPSGHVQMHPPPPPPPSLPSIRALPPPPLLPSIGSMPPPPPAMLVPSMQPRRVPPPPPPSVPVSVSSMNHPMTITMPSLTIGRPVPHFTQPPPPPPPPPSTISTTVINTGSLSKNDFIEKMDMSNSLNGADVAVPGTESREEMIKLPQAVEKVFALKTERAQLLGVDPDSVITPSVEKESLGLTKSSGLTLVPMDENEDMEDIEEEDKSKKSNESKNRRRKKKKKQKKAPRFAASNEHKIEEKTKSSKFVAIDIDIEYIQDVLDPADPMYTQFIGIFEKFKLSDAGKEKGDLPPDASKDVLTDASNKATDKKKANDMDDDDDDDDDDDKDDEKKNEDKPKLSKRKMKKLSRMSVAELKQKVGRPELVEMHDVTAKDPVLLLHLKASRNTVPVPRHWCFKRKYLQGKRGIEKPAFELPDFIKRTGIMEMRQALQEKEDQKTMKAKMRERVRPKLGKIDIDYQKLHDAFFKWQTKPKMTIHGDLYYEGKEFETRLKEKKPGDLSDDLRIALGMPTGPNANKCPPPWLIAMQRYGPPPSYPNLKIPGLNAPIPDSCSFGYHAGGWGKPPVDEMGRPLYGDVFGIQAADNMPQIPEEEIDHTLWGELESESSEEEEDEDDEDDEEEEAKPEDETGLVTPAEGLITPSGFSSIPAGMETPDMIELRKRKTEAEMEGGETPALYTILPEKKADRVGAAMMGSTHIYDLAAAIPASKVKAAGTTSVPPQGIEVALDPSELEMDTAAMAARYEQTMREQQSQLQKEDLSDMVAEHAARQKTKRKKQQQDSGKAPKKYKEFKF